MNPNKVIREKVVHLQDLPNVGKAMADDLHQLGLHTPEALIGRDPFQMHATLCQITGVQHDPCVIDVFMSIVSFMNGGEPLPWWSFTARRKELQRTFRQ
jgi:hypothetical protein